MDTPGLTWLRKVIEDGLELFNLRTRILPHSSKSKSVGGRGAEEKDGGEIEMGSDGGAMQDDEKDKDNEKEQKDKEK